MLAVPTYAGLQTAPRVPTTDYLRLRGAPTSSGRWRAPPPATRALDTCSLTDADILAVMPDCDAMVTDVSSVGLDWLYLRTESPLLIADRHDDPDQRA